MMHLKPSIKLIMEKKLLFRGNIQRIFKLKKYFKVQKRKKSMCVIDNDFFLNFVL